MSQLAMELKAQQDIELLRQQLSVAASEILALRAANKECVSYFNEMQKDLAASQARELQLRKALVIADNAGDDEWYPYTPEQAKTAIGKALALPQDTSALEAMIQKAGEVMWERCLDFYDYDCRLAIRAIPAVTLEDLKK